MTVKSFLIVLVLPLAASASTVFSNYPNTSIPESISQAPNGFGSYGGSYFVTDATNSAATDATGVLWIVPHGGSPALFATTPYNPRDGLFLPADFGSYGGEFAVSNFLGNAVTGVDPTVDFGAVNVYNASGASTTLYSGMNFDATSLAVAPAGFGSDGGKLLVGYTGAVAGIAAIDSSGNRTDLVTGLPFDAIDMAFAPAGFGAYAGLLFISSDRSPVVEVVNGSGNVSPFVALPFAPNQGLKFIGWAPSGFGQWAGDLIVGVPGANFSSNGSLLVIDAAGDIVGQFNGANPRGFTFTSDGSQMLVNSVDPEVLELSPGDFTATPEPATLALAGAGAMALWWWRRKRLIVYVLGLSALVVTSINRAQAQNPAAYTYSFNFRALFATGEGGASTGSSGCVSSQANPYPNYTGCIVSTTPVSFNQVGSFAPPLDSFSSGTATGGPSMGGPNSGGQYITAHASAGGPTQLFGNNYSGTAVSFYQTGIPVPGIDQATGKFELQIPFSATAGSYRLDQVTWNVTICSFGSPDPNECQTQSGILSAGQSSAETLTITSPTVGPLGTYDLSLQVTATAYDGTTSTAQIGSVPPCVVPIGEITTATSWESTPGYTTLLDFKQSLLPTTTNFGGRIVQEINGAAGSDSCWDPLSAYPQNVFVGGQGGRGGTWAVASDNSWGPDQVGWNDAPQVSNGKTIPGAVTYYRQAGRAPCQAVLRQQMQMLCPDGTWKNYGGVNTLIDGIGTNFVTSSRAAVQASKRY